MLNYLVADILDFAQMKQGKFRKNIQYFDLKLAVEEVISILQYKADQLGINISLKISNSLKNRLNIMGNMVCFDQ